VSELAKFELLYLPVIFRRISLCKIKAMRRILMGVAILISFLGCKESETENALPIKQKEQKVIAKKEPIEKVVPPTETIEIEDFAEGEYRPKPELEAFDITYLNSDYESCLDYNCEEQLYAAWDTALNVFYRNAVKIAEKEESKTLKKAQKAWLIYQKAEEEFIGLAFVAKVGDVWKVKSNILEIRTYELGLSKSGSSGDYDQFINNQFKAYYGEDTFFENCEGHDGSSFGISLCAEKTTAYYQKKLNNNYNRLTKILSKEAQQKLKIAQQKWIQFKKVEVSIYDSVMMDMGGGNVYGVYATKLEAALIKRRSLDLSKYVDLLK
jgi:uncharacterized protein YecT (DUF1311 family)